MRADHGPEAPRFMEQPHTADDAEMAALTALGFSKPLIAMLSDRARRNGTSLEKELLHSGQVTEAAYYGAMARFLRLPFIDTIDPTSITDMPALDVQLHQPTVVRINHRYQPPQMAVVPEAGRLADLKVALSTLPQLGRDLVITSPSAVRNTVWQVSADRRRREAVNMLFDRTPHFSARVVLSGRQGFGMGLGTGTLIATLITSPLEVLFLLHVLLSLTYLASLVLRLAALTRRRFRPPPAPQPVPDDGVLPVYTVMVALYREAAVAGQLVSALQRLDWPPSLLDIKLICEADDEETIAALEAQRPGAHFEIVKVPPSQPRTKPKALAYALGAARGEFLAIYDAEDRPHPGQLREAFRRFRSATQQLACLQAPLIITNSRETWISALFSLEYSGLFRGLLPMLAETRMPLPLGGTSNHFRTEILQKVGGWDPFNVTEDADLGMRLYRMGYRSGVLDRQTLEDAPTTLKVWMGQRSRWFKGWLQTWLVLMRHPRRLVHEMGWKAFGVFQLMIGGMLISSLLHPLSIVFIGLAIWSMTEAPTNTIDLKTLLLFAVDTTNVIGSYLIFVTLGLRSMIEHERKLVGRKWMAVPLYWAMISIAAWMAVFELRFRPFFWNKTPHQPTAPSLK